MAVIKVDKLSKEFRVYKEKKATLKEKVLRMGKSNYERYIALDNVSLSIEKGETIALVGRNGSGKSTLLKLLTKIIYPTQGTLEINGRVSSLLELGAGFHPDFTGRENIYMNASILGLTKREINNKLDEIIKFSELGEFIERPVRVYSSGMYMRLAFSIAINVEPDILLIDEILAVGDAAFQNKCLNKIKELKGQGKTIVIVTHDNGVVEKLCDKAVWLQNGKVIEVGYPKEIIIKYMTSLSEMENERLIREDTTTAEVPAKDEIAVPVDLPKNSGDRWGNNKIVIKGLSMTDESGAVKKSFVTGDSLKIFVQYEIRENYENVVFGIGIFTPSMVCCYGTNTFIDGVDLINIPREGTVEFNILELNLVPGEYLIDVAIHHENGEPYDYLTKGYRFLVSSPIQDTGIARQTHTWSIQY